MSRAKQRQSNLSFFLLCSGNFVKKMNFFSFSSSLHILVFSLLCLLSGFPVSHSNPEIVYENCRYALFECGKISIGYPFSGGRRQLECGHPALRLHCDDDTNITSIKIHGVKYRVLEIRHENQTLKISREDFFNKDGFCRPQTPIHDSIIDSELFDPVPGYTKVTLFYDCPSAASHFLAWRSLPILNCSDSDYHNVSVAADPDMPKYGEGCLATVTFPISGKIVDSFRSLSETLETGFEVKWNEDTQACGNCNASGGTCGFSPTQAFCFCPGGLQNSMEYPYECQAYLNFHWLALTVPCSRSFLCKIFNFESVKD